MSLHDRVVLEGGGYDDPPDLSSFLRRVLKGARATPGASGLSKRGLYGKTVIAIIKTMRKQGDPIKMTEAHKKQVEKALAKLEKRDLLGRHAASQWSEKAKGQVSHTRVTTRSATSIKASGYKELLEKKLKAAGIKSASVERGRDGKHNVIVTMSIPDVVKLAALPSFKLPTKDEARAHRHEKGKGKGK